MMGVMIREKTGLARVCVALAVALLLFGTVLSQAAAQEGDGPRLTVITRALNVRSGPGTTYPRIAGLRQGEQVDVVGRHAASGWYQVELANGAAGWVSGSQTLVTTSGNTAGLPEVSVAAPTPARRDAGAGLIVFQTVSGGPIYAANPDGSGLRQLTTGIDPALSPEGTRVAFTRWDHPSTGASGSLWVINTDGSGERMVYSDVRQPKSPTWSPDGSEIIINMQEGGRLDPQRQCGGMPPRNAYDIEVDVDERGQVKVCYTLPVDPWWGLRKVNVADGAFEDLPRDSHSFSPAWHPSEAWHVVYAGDQGLVNLDVNQNTTWPLSQDTGDRSPVFSPDGSRLAVSYHQHDHWEVHVMNADGSGRVRLTNTPYSVLADQLAKGQPQRAWNNAAPVWSPDGQQIAFLTDRTGAWEIWVMQADGSNQRPLFAGGMPAGISLRYDGVDERVMSWR